MVNTELLVWKLFECTGEISYYLLYRGMQNNKQLEHDAGMSM
ncbi:MAG: YqzL family protein [Clostridia bacterium]|nr:YqzL family protein [Clostridia bacterium]